MAVDMATNVYFIINNIPALNFVCLCVKKNTMKRILFICIAFAGYYNMNAQKTKGDSIAKDSIGKEILSAMLSVSMDKIMFDRPDTNFIELTDASGYRYEKINASIKAIILPGNYSSAEKELSELKSDDVYKNLDTMHHFVNNKAAFSLIQERIMSEAERKMLKEGDNQDHENYIFINTVIPNSEFITYGVVGAYPKSHDKDLRKKFIASALSLMK